MSDPSPLRREHIKRLWTLGRLELHEAGSGDGRSVLGRPKLLALLVYLAVARPQGFRARDELLALFWPESDTSRARAALRKSLHRLRRALGPDTIPSRGDSVRVDPERLWCDAPAFEERLEAGDRSGALELYRGEMLPGFHLSGLGGFERWLDQERARLRRRARSAAWKLSGEARAGDESTEAVRWARRALRIDPFDESGVRRLVELLRETGDRAGALDAVENFRRRLRGEYGMEPSAHTLALMEAIQAEASRERSGPADPSPAPGFGSDAESGRNVRAPDEPADGEARVGQTGRTSRTADRTEPDRRDVSGADPATSSPRPVYLRVGAGVAAVAVVIGFLSLRAGDPGAFSEARAVSGLAPPAAVGVFPFRVTDGAEPGWTDDLPVLLGASLTSLPGFASVEPTRVARSWETVTSAASGERRSVERATAGLRARWGVTGRAVRRDGTLRLSAEAFDAARGAWIGPVRVSGPADSLVPLVDRLTLALLEGGLAPWDGARPDGHIAPDLRGVRAGSLAALRSYLRGEAHFRSGRWDQALPEYHEAVAADSGFAMALYRLGDVYDWMGRGGAAIQYYRVALARGERLQSRERRLIQGVLQESERRTDALDTLVALTERHPHFADGWTQLGEAYFHVGRRVLARPEDYRRAFGRGIELDPSFAPAYVHLIEDAFFRGDSADAARLVARYTQAVASPPRAAGHELAWRLAFGDAEEVRRAYSDLDAASMGPWDTFDVVLGLLQLNPDHRSRMDSVAAIQLRRSDSVVLSWNAWFHLLRAYPRAGRFREGREILRRRMAVHADRRRMASSLLVWEAALPGGPPHAGDVLPGLLESDPSPTERFWIGLHGLETGQEDLLSGQLAVLDGSAEPIAGLLARALRGVVASRRGDAPRAYRLLSRVHDEMSDGQVGDRVLDFLRFELGSLHRTRGEFRAALRHFLAQNHYADLYVARRELELARTYDAMGESDRAATHYRRFARWWRDCDEAGRPLVEEAETALARLRVNAGAAPRETERPVASSWGGGPSQAGPPRFRRPRPRRP